MSLYLTKGQTWADGDIITATKLNATGLPTDGAVSTIAALKALTITSTTTNTAVYVNGYYASGDGGGGWFYFNSASSATDNGGTIIQPTSGSGRWLRIINDGILNVRYFGAVGDGATDDTTAIQAALTLATTLGQTVYLPASTYVHTGLTIYSNTTLLGDGVSSVLYTKNSSNADALTTYNANALFGTNSQGGVAGVHLSNFVIEGNKSNQSSGRGLVAYWYNSRMEQIIIRNTKDLGIKEEWGTGGVPAPNIVMENSYIDVSVVAPDSATDGWYHNGPHDSRFYGCSVVEGIGFAGLRTGTNSSGDMFVNCHPFGYIQISRSPSWQVVFDGAGSMWADSTAEGGSVGQILLRAVDCQVIGGWQYNIATSYNEIGIQIGDTANGFTNITGTNINTKLTNFYTAFIKFDSSGGLDAINVTGYATTVGSTITTGTIPNTTRIIMDISGPGGGTVYKEPVAARFLSTVEGQVATTDQFPDPAFTAVESQHASSRRAVIQLGTNWQLIQDVSGNGTRNFEMLKLTGTGRSIIFQVDTSGNIILPSLPTSTAGLSSGAVWSNSNVLTVIP